METIIKQLDERDPVYSYFFIKNLLETFVGDRLDSIERDKIVQNILNELRK